MPAYYFDSVAGNDANDGLSWATAFKGVSKQIASYIASNNTVWLKGSWDNQIGGTFTGLANFELRAHPDGATLDCRTRHNSGWTNVSGSRVWKKSFNSMVHRVIFGSNSVHGFFEGADAAKRDIQVTFNPGIAATDAEVVTILNTTTANQARMWYWDGVSNTLYVRSTNNTTDPDTAYGGVYTVDGSDGKGAWPDRRHWMPFEFVNCTNLFFGRVHIRGAVRPLTLVNTGGTIEPYCTEYPHYQWQTVQCTGSSTDPRPSLTVNDCYIHSLRPYFNEYHSVDGYDDGNGVRSMGGSDILSIANRWNNFTVTGGVIETGHGGIAMMYFNDPYITSALIQRVYFDGSLRKYGRAFGLQQPATGRIGSFIVEYCTIDRQSVHSQIGVDNFILRYCVFRNGTNGWIGDGTGPNYVDKYNPSMNWAGRWRNSNALAISVNAFAVDANQMIFEDNVFYGQYDEVLGLDYAYTNLNHIFRNNWCIKVSAIAGVFGDTIVKNYGNTVGGVYVNAAISYSGNKYTGYGQTGYGGNVVPGFTTMTAGEITTQTARALANTATITPSNINVTVGSTAAGTVSVLDINNNAVSNWTGQTSTTAPSVATSTITGTNVTVTGVTSGNTTLVVTGLVGALRSTASIVSNAVAALSGRAPIFSNRRRKT